jgi:hypothetical protein
VGIAARRRRWDLLLLLASTLVGGAVIDRWAVIPLAVMAGLAVDAALEHPARRRSFALLVIAGVVAITGVAFSDRPTPISVAEREVMTWAAASTGVDATFAQVGLVPGIEQSTKCHDVAGNGVDRGRLSRSGGGGLHRLSRDRMSPGR